MLAFRADTMFDRRMFLALGMPLLSGIANGSTADGAKTRKAKSVLVVFVGARASWKCGTPSPMPLLKSEALLVRSQLKFPVSALASIFPKLQVSLINLRFLKVLAMMIWIMVLLVI